MKTIAFDLDGTLISIKKRDFIIYSDILTELEYEPLDIEFYWSLRCSRYNITDLLQLSNLKDIHHVEYFLSQRKERMEMMRYLSLDSILPNVSSTILALKKEYRCIIVTKRHNYLNTKKQLENLGLNIIFDEVIITEDNKLSSFKQVDGLSVVVGDTENDIFPAKELGLKTIGITTGIRNKSLLQLMQPLYVIDNITELLTILCS